MKLKFEYNMRLSFSGLVTEHRYVLRCVPHDTKRQKITSCELSISPEGKRNEYTDFFKNRVIYGTIAELHESFEVRVSGTAETGLDIYEEFESECDIYRVPSRLTKPGEGLCALYRDLCKAAPNAPYDRALFFMRSVHEKIKYESGVTDVKTTAEEAAARGRGVCQDYAHILISLLRLDGLPARYSVGMMKGEGESHAWTEVNLGGYWYGLDAANSLLTDGTYIKISHGRDYSDTVISKGIFKGAAGQHREITVLASETEDLK